MQKVKHLEYEHVNSQETVKAESKELMAAEK